AEGRCGAEAGRAQRRARRERRGQAADPGAGAASARAAARSRRQAEGDPCAREDLPPRGGARLVMRGRWRHVGAASVWLFAAATAGAQENLSVVGPEPATVRLGDAARAEIRVVDPSGTPRDFELPTVDGLRLHLTGPSQQMEQRWNGQ